MYVVSPLNQVRIDSMVPIYTDFDRKVIDLQL